MVGGRGLESQEVLERGDGGLSHGGLFFHDSSIAHPAGKVKGSGVRFTEHARVGGTGVPPWASAHLLGAASATAGTHHAGGVVLLSPAATGRGQLGVLQLALGVGHLQLQAGGGGEFGEVHSVCVFHTDSMAQLAGKVKGLVPVCQVAYGRPGG